MAKSMQIKSNQDVREYREVVYFGMTLRQRWRQRQRWGYTCSATAG